MATVIEWNGQPFALLVEGSGGSYLTPPIVLDVDDRPIEGSEILEAIVQSGVSIDYPVVRAATPDVLAEVERRMKHISETLRVPIGPRK